MEFCPHCMRPAKGKTCPDCGRSLSYENNANLLPVGTVLKGGAHSYRIGEALGQGGFGVTYIALDLSDNRQVAVKEYFPARCASRAADGSIEPKPNQEAVYEGGRFSFLQEAKMLASLEGMPAVVQGLDYLETNNTAYLVMEFLDGTPLYQVVQKRGRILAEELMPMLKPLLENIARLHEAGIIHRDISPDNIMWMPDNTLKLLDFGCARSMEDGKSMTVLIKKGFAPVEQYQRHGQGPYTDVYALAATIYYCLTGIIPPESPARMLDGKELKSPISLGAALTPEEERALMWGLEIYPKTRPANMDVFSKRLFPISPISTEAKEEIDPPPRFDTISEPPPPPPPRPKIKGWVVAACIVAAAFALIVTSLMFASIIGSF